jgi:hypothetical protein
MMNHLVIVLGCIALLCACNKTSTFEVSPEYLTTAHERPLLTVPHREWVEQGCYPKRELKDGKWVEVKICDKK